MRPASQNDAINRFVIFLTSNCRLSAVICAGNEQLRSRGLHFFFHDPAFRCFLRSFFFLLTTRSEDLEVASEGETSWILMGWSLEISLIIVIIKCEWDLTYQSELYLFFLFSQHAIQISLVHAILKKLSNIKWLFMHLCGTLSLSNQLLGRIHRFWGIV